MATLLFSAAGSAAGSALGGAVGAAALGATLGRAAGALAGGLIDRMLLGGSAPPPAAPTPPPRLMSAREGAPVPRIYGRYRVAAQVIWASQFRVRTERAGGGKHGDGSARSRYSISLALGLCEGPIDRIGRIWADGKPLATGRVQMRLHRGGEDQLPDPLIEGIEGAGHAPAYRGLAYLVIEELELAPFGERIPQLSVEVFRQPRSGAQPLAEMVEAVALSPGSGEFALETEPVRRRLRPGVSVTENVNNIEGRPDLLVSLDQLREEAPGCGAVSLIVSWFGDDLRCGQCRLTPRLEQRDKRTEPVVWSVAGLDRETAPLVSRDGDARPVYGGTPSDRSVVNAIRAMRARGLEVMFYPFILMDIPAGNGLPDPYGRAEQPAHPWRGRITLGASADQTPQAGAEAAAFIGSAQPGDFRIEGGEVVYTGPDEWSLRRMILHYAHLCAAAGGVDAFCIGSELRGLTWIRDGRASYPVVRALKRLAQEVKAILPDARIGYAADWSEYFGHHDGADAIFHLDPLWSDPAIDFIGVDNYAPLTDWRDGEGHLDADDAASIHDLAYLQSRIEGGEGYDWYYASDADRRAQRRTPIADGAHGEHWVYRPKDFRGWWENAHHDRIDGVRQTAPTGWVPGSKPIWFTEIGCAAVDKGANQPNVFVDAKSSESALPHFSTGARDDHMQRRFLEASLSYWRDPRNNPDGMIDTSRAFIWTWDARPWPDFPQRREVWADAANHPRGHWITGRLGAAGLAETVAEICAEAGVAADVSGLEGSLDGFCQPAAQSPRAALRHLSLAFGFDAVESGARLRFVPRGGPAVAAPDPANFALERDAASALELSRAAGEGPPQAVRFGWLDADADYAEALSEARGPGAARVEQTEAPLVANAAFAQAVALRWRAELQAAAETARFALPPEELTLEPGDVIALEGGLYRVDRISEGETRQVEAARVIRPGQGALAQELAAPARPAPPPLLEPLEAALIELPPLPDGDPGGVRAYAFADPWPGRAALRRRTPDGSYDLAGMIERPAVMGALAAPLGPGDPHLWDRGPGLEVELFGGSLRGADASAVLAGANLAAVEHAPGRWEALQFRDATLIGPARWRLGPLLRGRGDGAAPGAPIGARFVLLDGAGLRLDLAPGEIGAETRWRLGPLAAPADYPAQTDLTLIPTGRSERPPAPARVRARRSPGGWEIDWSRRSALDRDLWVTDAPLGDARDRYRIRVLKDGAELARHETGPGPWIYDDASAAAAGAVAPFQLAIAQLSNFADAGDETRIEING